MVSRSFWEPLFTENFNRKKPEQNLLWFSYRIFKTTYMLTK